jgi:hypothetical protein
MTEYFVKARELGRLILQSKQAEALAEANLSGGDTAKACGEYQALVNQVLDMIKATVYESKEDEADGHCGGCRNRGKHGKG